MGYIKLEYRGLYYQLSWAVQQLSIGYYGLARRFSIGISL